MVKKLEKTNPDDFEEESEILPEDEEPDEEDLEDVDIDDDDDDEVLDDEDEEDEVAVLDDEDEEDEEVEASLDVILRERLVVPDDSEEDSEDEDEEDIEPEDKSEIAAKVLPKRPGEFVCASCFLVKHPSQLADREHMLCRDCV